MARAKRRKQHVYVKDMRDRGRNMRRNGKGSGQRKDDYRPHDDGPKQSTGFRRRKPS